MNKRRSRRFLRHYLFSRDRTELILLTPIHLKMQRDTFCNTWCGLFSLRRWTMSKVLETSKGCKAFTIYPGCPTVPVVTMGLFLRRMKELKVIFYEVLPIFRKSIPFWKVPMFSSFVPVTPVTSG